MNDEIKNYYRKKLLRMAFGTAVMGVLTIQILQSSAWKMAIVTGAMMAWGIYKIYTVRLKMRSADE